LGKKDEAGLAKNFPLRVERGYATTTERKKGPVHEVKPPVGMAWR